jgi:hypothetical protein
MSQIHVILADYNYERMAEVAESLAGLGAVVHQCGNRIEAMGKYWLLYAEGILPRAVVASWLMDTPDSRAFFSAVGREVDHTSLALFSNVCRLDPAGILICYSDDLPETVTELEHAGVADKVVVVRSCLASQEVAGLIKMDERSRLAASKTSGYGSDIRIARKALLSR